MIRWVALVSSALFMMVLLHSEPNPATITAGISALLLFFMAAVTLIWGGEVSNMEIGEIQKEVTFEPIPEDVPVPEIVPEPVVEPEKEPANV